jgi:hypothetical protein
MASTIGTARGTTHGSWRPLPVISAALPSPSIVCWLCIMVATGLKATLNSIGIPLLIPPWMPPEKLVRVPTLPSAFLMKISLCSDPRISLPLKPEPNSKPCTALMLSMALPRSACSLSKTGSPRPTGAIDDVAAYLAANGIALLTDAIDKFYHFFGSGRVGTAHNVLFACL